MRIQVDYVVPYNFLNGTIASNGTFNVYTDGSKIDSTLRSDIHCNTNSGHDYFKIDSQHAIKSLSNVFFECSFLPMNARDFSRNFRVIKK